MKPRQHITVLRTLLVYFVTCAKIGSASLENEYLERGDDFGYDDYGRGSGPHRCIISSGDDLMERKGFCYGVGICEELAGTPSGSKCACDDSIEKICCLFNATCDRSTDTITVKRDLTYITHRQNEEECLTDYSFPRQHNICQLRLEFKKFNLSPPNSTGNCMYDKMTIINADNLSANLVLCGRANETDHLYLHYGDSNEIVINLDVGQPSEVEILVQQISCNSEDLAPAGCSQYFTQQRANVQSFNFDRATGQQLNNQVYAVCVKGSEGSHSVTWNPCNGAEDFDIITPTAAAGCPTDSVTIPGSLGTKFCTRGSLIEVTTLAKPYVMYVNFNEFELPPIPPRPPNLPHPCPPGWTQDPNPANPEQCIPDPSAQNPNPPADILNRGFCLRYQRA